LTKDEQVARLAREQLRRGGGGGDPDMRRAEGADAAAVANLAVAPHAMQRTDRLLLRAYSLNSTDVHLQIVTSGREAVAYDAADPAQDSEIFR
jgi:hypothetical protein